MPFLRQRRPPNRLISIGLLCLAAANVFHYLVASGRLPTTGFDDLVQGFLMGISIALVLLGVRRRSQPCDTAPTTSATP